MTTPPDWENETHIFDPVKHKPLTVMEKCFAAFCCCIPFVIVVLLFS
jgi:hypothetical protein